MRSSVFIAVVLAALANGMASQAEARERVSFWRKDPPVMSEDGAVLKGGMLEHQTAWWTLPNFIKLLVGGYGSGKTLTLVKRAISASLSEAPNPVGMVSPSFPQARRTIIPTLRAVLSGKRTLLKGFDWTENKTEHTFQVRHGARIGHIWVMSGDEPDSLKGANLAAAYIDEPFIMDRAVFIQMLARTRVGRHREIGLAGTPEQLEWAHELVEGELGKKLDVGYIRAATTQNYTLPADYVQTLKAALGEQEAQVYVDGKFVDLDKGRVYYAFDRAIHIAVKPVPDGARWFAGMDFNVNPMAFVVGWRIREGAAWRIHIVAVVEQANSDTSQACAEIRRRWPQVDEVVPDASGAARHTASEGRTDHDLIRAAGFKVTAHRANPSRRARYNSANGALRRGLLTIDPSCSILDRYLRTYTHEHMKRQAAMSHALDALTYPVEMWLPVSRPAARIRQLA